MCTYLSRFTTKVHSLLKVVKQYDVPSMWCPCKVRRKMKNFQYDRYELAFFYSFTCCFCLFFFQKFSETESFSSSETQGQSVGSGERARRKFSSTGERAPGYRLSPNYFQKFKPMPAPDWAQKVLCILVPNRRTVPPEFFSWVRTRRLLSCHTCPVRSPSLCEQGKLLFSTFPNQKLGRNYRWVEKTFGMLLAGAIAFAPRIFCFWLVTMYRK